MWAPSAVCRLVALASDFFFAGRTPPLWQFSTRSRAARQVESASPHLHSFYLPLEPASPPQRHTWQKTVPPPPPYHHHCTSTTTYSSLLPVSARPPTPWNNVRVLQLRSKQRQPAESRRGCLRYGILLRRRHRGGRAAGQRGPSGRSRGCCRRSSR